MKVKTSELTGAALAWTVNLALGGRFDDAASFLQCYEDDDNGYFLKYATDWSQGGPIIERERINVFNGKNNDWCSSAPGWISDVDKATPFVRGTTPLIAAMRCFVTSKLGNEVDVPEELLWQQQERII